MAGLSSHGDEMLSQAGESGLSALVWDWSPAKDHIED